MSFVDTYGADTADPAVHGFAWMRFADNAEGEGFRAWQPWMRWQDRNGVLCFQWVDCVSFFSEVALFDASILAVGVVTSPPGPARVRAGLVTVARSIQKVRQTRAQGATALSRAARNLSPADRAICTIGILDTILRDGNAQPQWQASITYGLLETAATGAEALVALYYYEGDAMRTPPGTIAMLLAVRRAAERTGRLRLVTGYAPYPAPPPAPLPTDDVDALEVAYAICEAMGDNGFNDPAQRVSYPVGPARAASRQAEVEGIVTRPTGDSPEMRRRAFDTVGACATNITLLLDPRGDEIFTTGRAVTAMTTAAAQCVDAVHRAPAVLFTIPGMRALHNGLIPHVAWMNLPDVLVLALQDKLEKLSDRCTLFAANAGNAGGSQFSAVGAGAFAGGGATQTGGPTNSLGWRQSIVMATQSGDAAGILHEVEALLHDQGTRSEDIHELLFRGCSQAAPARRSTGLLHAMAWGSVDAGALNPSWALIKVYSTDEAIGRYLFRMVTDYLLRNRQLTPDQVSRISGTSLVTLAKALRSSSWGKGTIDIQNDVIRAITAQLAEASSLAAPPKTPSYLVYADHTQNTRIPGVTSCVLEALGMQRDGDGSLRAEMDASHATIVGNADHLPPGALAKLLRAQKELWEAGWQELGDLYHPTRGGTNASAALPTQNLRNGEASSRRVLFDRLFHDLTAAYQQQALIGQASGTAKLSGADALAAANEELRRSSGAKKQPRLDGGADDKDEPLTKKERKGKPSAADAADEEAEKQRRRNDQDEKLRQKYGSERGKMQGTQDAPVFVFGDKHFDVKKAREAWPKGCCVPSLCAASLGGNNVELRKLFARNACPVKSDDPNAADHKWGAKCHAVPDGAAKGHTFIIAAAGAKKKGKGMTDAKGKGKGKGKK